MSHQQGKQTEVRALTYEAVWANDMVVLDHKLQNVMTALRYAVQSIIFGPHCCAVRGLQSLQKVVFSMPGGECGKYSADLSTASPGFVLQLLTTPHIIHLQFHARTSGASFSKARLSCNTNFWPRMFRRSLCRDKIIHQSDTVQHQFRGFLWVAAVRKQDWVPTTPTCETSLTAPKGGI